MTPRRRPATHSAAADRLARRHRDGQPRVRRALPVGRPVPARRRPSHPDSADAHRSSSNSATVVRDSARAHVARNAGRFPRRSFPWWAASSTTGPSCRPSRCRALLAELADAVLAAELPGPHDDDDIVEADISVRTESSRYEALLDESMRLFNLNGYRDTGMEDIAAAVGMPASGIYRYFSGKSDILAAAFRRAADRLSADTASITATIDDPQDALTAIIDAYVVRSFDQPELDYVYYTERHQHVRFRPEDPAQHGSVPPSRHGWNWWWRCDRTGRRDRRGSPSTPRCHW